MNINRILYEEYSEIIEILFHFRSRKTEDSVAKSYYDVGKNVLNGVELESAGCDVTFVCADGSVKAHQVHLFALK